MTDLLDTLTDFTHEEALRFVANYLVAMKRDNPHSQRTLAVERLMKDIKKMHAFLQLIAEVDNLEATRELQRYARYDKFRDPHLVKQVREFIQEL